MSNAIELMPWLLLAGFLGAAALRSAQPDSANFFAAGPIARDEGRSGGLADLGVVCACTIAGLALTVIAVALNPGMEIGQSLASAG